MPSFLPSCRSDILGGQGRTRTGSGAAGKRKLVNGRISYFILEEKCASREQPSYLFFSIAEKVQTVFLKLMQVSSGGVKVSRGLESVGGKAQ